MLFDRSKEMRDLILIAAVVVVIGLATVMISNETAEAELKDTMIDEEYIAICEEVGAEYNIAPELLEAIIENESAGEQYATNGTCYGLCQINYGVHVVRMQNLGLHDIYNPRTNITLAADILNECKQKYGDDLMMTLMMYNGTAHAIMQAEAGHFSEYAIKVSKRAEELETVHGKKKLSKYTTNTKILKNRGRED